MSLVITTYVPEGMVLASDSRQFITINKDAQGDEPPVKIETVNSDNVYKTFLLEKKGGGKSASDVGISTFGADLLGNIPTAGHIKSFSEEALSPGDNVDTIAHKLVEFFDARFPGADTGFHVAGYLKEGKTSVPYVLYCDVKNKKVERRNLGPDGKVQYGSTWSGQIDVISGIIQPSLVRDREGSQIEVKKPPILWGAMALQDAIDFTIYAIRTTIDTIRFQARPKSVGGAIDVLVITPEEARWIQKKHFYGE